MRNYLSNWSFMRFIRLILGIIITIQGIDAQQWMLIGLGGLFTLMPLFNIGCCDTAGCHKRYSTPKAKSTADITYQRSKIVKKQ